MLFTRKTAVLAKIESTYGTDAVPTGATDATVIRNATLTPIDMMLVDRALVRPYMGASPQLVAGQKVILAFEVEIAGAGTSAVTIPKFDPLLQACGFAGAVNGAISYDYSPVSSGFKSVTIYTYIDGIKHAITGAMGDVEFDFVTAQIPVMKFTFWGIYNAPADSTNPSLTTTGWQTPVGVNHTNTTGLALQGYATLVAQSVTIKVGNKLDYQTLIGDGPAGNPGEYVQITDRNMTGTINVRLPDTLAAKDFYIASKSQTLGTLTLQHGQVAFNIFKVAAPATSVQITKPTLGDLNGVRMLQLDLTFVPSSAGNDEIKFSTL